MSSLRLPCLTRYPLQLLIAQTSFYRALIATLRYQPVFVIDGHELLDGFSYLINIFKDSSLDDLLFKGSMESLCYPIGLWLPNKPKAAFYAQVGNLLEEVV